MTHNTHATDPSIPLLRPRYRLWNLLLGIGLIAAFPLAFVLPQWTGWENGLWEDIQTFTLIAGFFAAIAAARTLKAQSVKAFFIIAALFWMVFLGRELAWGAAFMPPLEMTEWGPSWRSKFLPYRPVISYVVGALAIAALYLLVRYSVWNQVLRRLVSERAVPGTALALFVVCMIMSANAEGHGFIDLQDWYGYQVMVVEELMESLAYLALLLAQTQVVYHLRIKPVA